MGGSLRFKVGSNHQYMKEAINKLNASITKAQKQGLFISPGGSTLYTQLVNHIPNYGYIYYEVNNDLFHPTYKQKKVKDLTNFI
jgi:hypothetical protein